VRPLERECCIFLRFLVPRPSHFLAHRGDSSPKLVLQREVALREREAQILALLPVFTAGTHILY